MRRRSSERSTRSRLAQAAYGLACAIALASIGTACGSDEPSATPAPTAAPTAPAPGEAVPGAAGIPAPPPADATAGETIAAEGVIPEGFPSDVPVYPGAVPGSSMSMPGLGVFATFESNDAAAQIVEHYRGELSKGGWSVTDSADGGGVDATKDKRSVQVRARQTEQGNAEIAINVSEG
jgi:hypothetical protein